MKTLLVTKNVEEIDHWATGQNACLYRSRRGLSQCDVAERMGVSPTYLSDLERGKRNWTPELVRRYQEAVK